METSATFRSYSVLPIIARAPQSPVASSVATVLPQTTQSVAPSVDAHASKSRSDQRGFGSPKSTSNSEMKRSIERDTPTGTLVYKVINPRSDEVVVQVPEERVLRLRAYFAEMAERSQPTGQRVARNA